MPHITEPCRVVPNLVPMIDIVSQLVIFFMLATQFISADVDTEVLLPELDESQAKANKESNKLFLNVRYDKDKPERGVIVAGGVNLTDRAASEKSDRTEDAKLDGVVQEALRNYDKGPAANRLAVIRADRRVQWQFIWQIMGSVTRYNQDKVNKAKEDSQKKGVEFQRPGVLDLSFGGAGETKRAE